MKLVSVLALLTLLAGYSGGADDSNAYQQAVDLAKAKEVDARLLAVDTPCNEVAQCGTVLRRLCELVPKKWTPRSL